MQDLNSFDQTYSRSKKSHNPSRFFALYLSLILASLSLLMQSGSVSLIDLVATQTHNPWHWFFVKEPLACLIFLTAFTAFTNKSPSTSSNVTSDLHHIKTFLLAAFFVLFFLGGGLVPFVSTQSLQNQASGYLFYSLFALSLVLVVLGGMSFAKLKKNPTGSNTSHTKILIEGALFLILGLIIFIATSISGKMVLSDEAAQVVATIFQGAVFLIKIFMVCGFFAWIRITLPRMKDKHLTRLGWIVLVPLALGNVVVTGVRIFLF